jgi:hypothetical protein
MNLPSIRLSGGADVGGYLIFKSGAVTKHFEVSIHYIGSIKLCRHQCKPH